MAAIEAVSASVGHHTGNDSSYLTDSIFYDTHLCGKRCSIVYYYVGCGISLMTEYNVFITGVLLNSIIIILSCIIYIIIHIIYYVVIYIIYYYCISYYYY